MTDAKDVKLFCALPTHSGARFNALALCNLVRACPGVLLGEGRGSLLAWVFNNLLQQARQLRDQGHVTHFLMLHDDVEPTSRTWWADLWAEYERTRADAICAAVVVKQSRVYSDDALVPTSLALDNGPSAWEPRRLSVQDVHDLRWHEVSADAASCPASFTHPQLLLNTGLLLFDLRAPWVDGLVFRVQDRVTEDGKCQVMSEDWDMSRQIRTALASSRVHHKLNAGPERDGARLVATTCVPVTHWGLAAF